MRFKNVQKCNEVTTLIHFEKKMPNHLYWRFETFACNLTSTKVNVHSILERSSKHQYEVKLLSTYHADHLIQLLHKSNADPSLTRVRFFSILLVWAKQNKLRPVGSMQLSLNIVCFSKTIPFGKVVRTLKDPMIETCFGLLYLKGMSLNSKGIQWMPFFEWITNYFCLFTS